MELKSVVNEPLHAVTQPASLGEDYVVVFDTFSGQALDSFTPEEWRMVIADATEDNGALIINW